MYLKAKVVLLLYGVAPTAKSRIPRKSAGRIKDEIILLCAYLEDWTTTWR